jgi:hypothetical protein
MKAYICLAALLILISSQSFASDTREASTLASPVTSTSAPAVSARPGLDIETRIKIRAEVGAVLTRIMSGDGLLNRLWSHSRAPQRPVGIADPNINSLDR